MIMAISSSVSLSLVDDAGVEGDLAAGHAERVDLLAADEVDLPAPLAGARIPLRGIRDEALGNGAQALQLRVTGICQRTLGLGFCSSSWYCWVAEFSSVSAGTS